MSRFSRAPGPQNTSILNTLRATEMIDSKAALPAEILVTILDYLPVSDLMRFARTSSRMREMVYDDTRWVARLKSMGLWNEIEARRRFDDAVRRRKEAQEREAKERAAAAGANSQASADAGRQIGAAKRQSATVFFDASVEQERRRRSSYLAKAAAPANAVPELRDGFETLAVTGNSQQPKQPLSDPLQDPEDYLQVLKNVKSVRGHAREEYGKVYGALGPFYFDLVRAKSHADPALFKAFRDPERQAQMLANLHVFAKSDWASGWAQREETLTRMTNIFESAVLREFEQGYEFWDVEGRMKRYAHVLHMLNSPAGVDLFIHKHPIFSDKEVLANSMDCINNGPADGITLGPSQLFFEVLTGKLREQAVVMEKIFPNPGKVFWALVDKVREDTIMDYATTLFDEARDRSKESYLKAVSGIFEQCLQSLRSLEVPQTSAEESEEKSKEQAHRVVEPHLDLYLQDELEFFQKTAEEEVGNWERKLSEQDATVESFYMSNFTKPVDKKDFLSSFKKTIMMPVTVLPSLPGQLLTSPFGSTTAKTASSSTANGQTLAPSASQTPGVGGPDRTASPLPEKAPTDELAAKAALMASRLEGIKSLFSIEVALNLVHMAKTSLGRAAVLIQLGGQAGEEAREQCAQIFVSLLRILGYRHIKPGFDKAVDHLAGYKAREVTDHGSQGGVAPLVTFIELVNVGDLISQMVDVFYEQQLLASPRIADRNDFLDQSGLAKKKFEQMLDESVAAGLNKGIDVLMDEVEYICATTQLPTDYNPMGPEAAGGGGSGNGLGAPDKRSSVASFASFGSGSTQGPRNSTPVMDLSPTQTARRVVDLVSSHTRMLVGSTEKTMLEVFNGEVGLRLFTAVCKHIKRQRVSTDGATRLIADCTLYFDYIQTLRNADLLAYFRALRELSQIYLIDPRHSKEMATIIADGDRFGGVFRAEEVYEFAERRADWYQVKRDVERAMYGLECCLM
ncbi:secretion pathway protein sls2 rcy1 [Diaporthe amygdali]|uniref:secretion pathway protein sls2 rcy1 n=1 Tax=Phomopsis amygdali TaxID=1214568 RepID=UPI0022FEE393|nr:secretion pathway protein sls2 rcy1 [Diaporthe amygdali]KAJ0116106.1 secretion pathway protein sls2 rcy1 [Diaporthe amygdali]